jgi:DNA-binding transcriptional ArsR family regulator
MRDLMALTKALADEQRVRIVRALQDGELCVCQIVELLALAPSTVSKHLAQLRQAGILEARKNGRWVYYRLADRTAPAVVRDALRLVRAALAGDATAKQDAARLKKILSIDPEVLCCQQRQEAAPARRPAERLASSSSARGTRRGAR